jgi:hypothetical protein
VISDQDEPLADLRFHWGSAYLVEVIGGRWIAQRRDSHETFSSDSPVGLLDFIREDYRLRPVPRCPVRDRAPLPAG